MIFNKYMKNVFLDEIVHVTFRVTMNTNNTVTLLKIIFKNTYNYKETKRLYAKSSHDIVTVANMKV